MLAGVPGAMHGIYRLQAPIASPCGKDWGLTCPPSRRPYSGLPKRDAAGAVISGGLQLFVCGGFNAVQ